jgi:hypothetical protein
MTAPRVGRPISETMAASATCEFVHRRGAALVPGGQPDRLSIVRATVVCAP